MISTVRRLRSALARDVDGAHVPVRQTPPVNPENAMGQRCDHVTGVEQLTHIVPGEHRFGYRGGIAGNEGERVTRTDRYGVERTGCPRTLAGNGHADLGERSEVAGTDGATGVQHGHRFDAQRDFQCLQ